MRGPMFIPGALVIYQNTRKLYCVVEDYGNGMAVCRRVVSMVKGKPYVAEGPNARYMLPTNRLIYQRLA